MVYRCSDTPVINIRLSLTVITGLMHILYSEVFSHLLKCYIPGPSFPYKTSDLSAVKILYEYELQVLICHILRSSSVQLTSMHDRVTFEQFLCSTSSAA
jgi:hypothetical protein